MRQLEIGTFDVSLLSQKSIVVSRRETSFTSSLSPAESCSMSVMAQTLVLDSRTQTYRIESLVGPSYIT